MSIDILFYLKTEWEIAIYSIKEYLFGMIIDRHWNKYEGKYTISYVDKDGNRQLIKKYLPHWKTYEYKEDGELDTWNGRKCTPVYKITNTKNNENQYSPNEFDELEYLYNLPEDVQRELRASRSPKLYTWDIETEISRDFPDPQKAEQRITAFSLVGPNLDCMVLGSHDLSDASKELLKQRYIDFIHNNEFAMKYLGNNEPKVIYKYFDDEKEMLLYWHKKLLPNICCLAGWNSHNFDSTYVYNRCVRLFGEGETKKLYKAISPTYELTRIRYEVGPGHHEYVTAPRHFMMVDYMLLCKQYDNVLKPYESYSLDWVAEHAVNSNKIKYEGTLQDLYEKDHEWYYYYNAVDSLLVMLIHKRLKCIESPCASSALTLVPYQTSQGQVALTVGNAFYEFYNDGKHVVYEPDAISRVKIDFEGAFVAAITGKHTFTTCYDFKSLYPSMIQTCNFSFENIHECMVGPDSLGRYVPCQWNESDLEKFRKDPQYFVSDLGTVYKNDKPYAFKKMQARLMLDRDKNKYLGQKIDRQVIFNIDKTIAGKPDERIEYTNDIKEFLNEFFPSLIDIDNIPKENLKKIKEEVSIKRDEYALLEKGCKDSMNAAYGACAFPEFYFFDPRIAADITAECRRLTKSMWQKYDHFYKNEIWDMKDIQEKYELWLDPSKKEWIQDKDVTVYSDTDSCYVSFGTIFKCLTKEWHEKYDTPEKKRDWILQFNDGFVNKQNGVWLDEMYKERNGDNVHVFEMEAINMSQIVLAKKKYVKSVMINKGKVYEKPKVSGTGVEIIKSTTPPLCRTILTDVIHNMLFNDIDDKTEYVLEFNELMRKYKKQFYASDYESISQSVGVGDYTKYVISDEDQLILAPKCPLSVQAVARFNHLAHKNGDDDKKIYSGKIKYYKISTGQRHDDIGYFGFASGELPSWRPDMYISEQWKTNVVDPLNRFLGALEIPQMNVDGIIQMNLFGF